MTKIKYTQDYYNDLKAKAQKALASGKVEDQADFVSMATPEAIIIYMEEYENLADDRLKIIQEQDMELEKIKKHGNLISSLLGISIGVLTMFLIGAIK